MLNEFIAYLNKQIKKRSQLLESLLQNWRKERGQQALVEACILLDEMNVGWDEECEQAAIFDWEVLDS